MEAFKCPTAGNIFVGCVFLSCKKRLPSFHLIFKGIFGPKTQTRLRTTALGSRDGNLKGFFLWFLTWKHTKNSQTGSLKSRQTGFQRNHPQGTQKGPCLLACLQKGVLPCRGGTEKTKALSGLPVRDKDEKMERNYKETKKRLILKAKRQVLKTVETKKTW